MTLRIHRRRRHPPAGISVPRHGGCLYGLFLALMIGGCDGSQTKDVPAPDSRLRYSDAAAMDAGSEAMDSRMVSADARAAADATSTGEDARTVQQDADTEDAGTPALDAGVSMSDSSAPDAGRADAGIRPGPDCGELPFVDFMETAQRDGMVYTYEGHVQGNQFRGSCTAPGTFGADTVLRFRAPAAGDWTFHTQGSEIDTNLYVRFRCLDAETELSCSADVDDRYRLYHSKSRIRLEDGEYIFVVVDTYQGLGNGRFRLTAQPFVANTPPQLEHADALILGGQEQAALVLQTVDPDGPPARVSYELRNAADEVILRGLSAMDSVSPYNDGRFRGAALVDWQTMGENPAVAINIRLVDFDGATSDWHRIEPIDEAPVQPRGELCDGRHFPCVVGLVCIESTCGDPQDVLQCPPQWPLRELVPDALGRVQVLGRTDQGQPLRTGSCGGGTATQVFSFTPEASGAHLVTVIGQDAGAQPIVYARRFCDFDEVDFAGELACSGEATPAEVPQGHERSAAVQLQLSMDESTFIFVDSDGRDGVPRWQGPYQLNIQPMNPPIVDEARSVLDLERELIGIYMAGTDVDFAQVTMRLLNINNEPILFADDELDWPVEMDQNDGPDGVFSVYGTTDIQGRVAARAARAIELLAWDRLGLVSMPLVTLFVEPIPRALGEGCDPNGLVDPCADEAHVCLGPDIYRCVIADP